jgi:hypothetical protein
MSCLPFAGLPLQCSHCRHPPIHAEYTSTLLIVHAIWSTSRHVAATAIGCKLN